MCTWCSSIPCCPWWVGWHCYGSDTHVAPQILGLFSLITKQLLKFLVCLQKMNKNMAYSSKDEFTHSVFGRIHRGFIAQGPPVHWIWPSKNSLPPDKLLSKRTFVCCWRQGNHYLTEVAGFEAGYPRFLHRYCSLPLWRHRCHCH